MHRFRLTKYQFHLRAEEEILLPQYKGSTFRGAFGGAFRRICCSQGGETCNGCILRETCPYAYVFETSPPPGSEVLRTLRDIPRPFVIEPELSTKTNYRPGEELSFGLVLIGRAIDLLPYFILTFREVGRIGIGKGRRRYLLERIEKELADGNKSVIFFSGDEMIINEPSEINFEDAKRRASLLPQDKVILEFLTPARIKFRGSLYSEFLFRPLFQRLIGRISSLLYFHCREKLDLDFKGLIERADKIKIESSDLKWRDWERYSKRQDMRMKLGGVLGTITYSGDLGEFLSFLALGEYVHIGKGTPFGLGKYRMS